MPCTILWLRLGGESVADMLGCLSLGRPTEEREKHVTKNGLSPPFNSLCVRPLLDCGVGEGLILSDDIKTDVPTLEEGSDKGSVVSGRLDLTTNINCTQ
jgi:hypothetical protein